VKLKKSVKSTVLRDAKLKTLGNKRIQKNKKIKKEGF